jgi:disease resistance protein
METTSSSSSTSIKKICTKQGCRKEYTDADNKENSCTYHDGKPIFHDIKKGWTCCNQIVYDWEEFMKIQGCKVGAHSNESVKETDFFKSSTVSTAEKGINNISNFNQNQPVVKDIKAYEEEQKKLDDEKKKKEAEKPREIIKAGDGKYYCGNPGCETKTFDPENNPEGACKHHTGNPVFHDRKKFWTCCKQEAYDWDDFVKLPSCAVGQHTPKYKN